MFTRTTSMGKKEEEREIYKQEKKTNNASRNNTRKGEVTKTKSKEEKGRDNYQCLADPHVIVFGIRREWSFEISRDHTYIHI